MSEIIWFGFQGFPVERVAPTPVGEPCLYCEEPIVEGDSGVITAVVTTEGFKNAPTHRKCFLRTIVGSVGHQKKLCSCYGGTEEDPPGMTKRQAAEAAYELAYPPRAVPDIRPVKCIVCKGQMYYCGRPGWEPEYSIDVEENHKYVEDYHVHKRCWDFVKSLDSAKIIKYFHERKASSN